MLLLPKAVGCLVLLVCLPALAQQVPIGGGQTTGSQTQSGFTFSLNNEFGYDENVLRQLVDPVASRLWTLNPRLAYQINRTNGSYTAAYEAIHNNYLDSPVDTVTNQLLTLQGEQGLNDFNKLLLTMTLNHGYEARGTGFNEGPDAELLANPTPIATHEVNGSWQLGADEARIRLIGSIGARETNRDSALIVNDSRDIDEQMLGLMLLYRLGFRTDLVAEYRDRTITYPRTPIDALGREIPLDSEEQQYLAGIDLRATAKTTGRLRVGTLARTFKWETAEWDVPAGNGNGAPTGAGTTTPLANAAALAPRTSGEDLFWELAAVWAPRTYSHFELNSRSSTRESLGIGSYIRSKDIAFLWSHEWSRKMATRLELAVGTDVFKDSTRIDKRKVANFQVSYELGESLNLGVGYRFQDLVSNFGAVGYDKSVFYLFANYRNRPTD